MAKVLLTEPIHESGIQVLKDAGLEVVISPSTDTKTLISLVQDDVIGIIVRASVLNGEVLAAGKNLKIVGRHGAGYDNIDVKTANQLHVIVTNVPNANSYSVAEYIVAVVLLLSRKLVAGDTALRTGKLHQQGTSLVGMAQKFDLSGSELSGKCIGIIGLGKIGLRVAKMVSGVLGMKVMACDPYKTEVPDGIEFTTDIEEIYRKADFISLHAPLTKDTENMISAKQLSIMKPSAYLINAARGGLVNDHDLAEALKTGMIAGAAVDVFHEEPPSLANPLFEAPNILLTPHVAGTTNEAIERLAVGAAQAVADFYCGKKPEHMVNPEVWEQITLLNQNHK